MITDDTYYPDSTGGTHNPHDDWERGYEAGYARALQHVLMMVEGDADINYRAEAALKSIVRIVAKLRQEVLHDEN